jgi:transposase
VEVSGAVLTEVFSVGPVLADTIVRIVGDVARLPSKGHFASYAGAAPIKASSGDIVRHRVSLAANRRLLNKVMYLIAVCQALSDLRGKAYYQGEAGEAKSLRKARSRVTQ